MKLIVGLGNPGRKFAKTRHNTGHQFISKFKVQISKLKIGDQVKPPRPARRLSFLNRKVKLHKTTVFMNDSGEEVKKITITYNLKPNNLLIVHDDMDVALGDFKLQFGRSAAGHKGVQSVIDALGTKEFWRLRLGIGTPPEGVVGEDYVLEKPSREELKILKNALEEAYPRVLEWVGSS